MSFYLIADIGGTNCRLAKFSVSSEGPSLGGEVWVPTTRICSEEALARAFTEAFPDGQSEAQAVAIAIAGPVQGGRASLTNGSLILDQTRLSSTFGKRVLLLNDFAAQAFAVISPLGAEARLVREGVREENGRIAVLGAGTGLGAASIGREGGVWRVTGSEAGHLPFPFSRDEEERALSDFLAERGLAQPSCEDLLQGRGLERIHTFETGEQLAASELAGRYLGQDSPTLRLYSRIFARFCRIWMLSTVCTGGLWIGGGIAINNPLIVATDAFKAELDLGKDLKFLKRIPIFLFSSANSGLWGAAQALHELLR